MKTVLSLCINNLIVVIEIFDVYCVGLFTVTGEISLGWKVKAGKEEAFKACGPKHPMSGRMTANLSRKKNFSVVFSIIYLY
jgi:hypothetical protein